MAELHPDIEEILLDEQDIKDIVKKVGAEITRDYADKNPLVIAVPSRSCCLYGRHHARH